MPSLTKVQTGFLDPQGAFTLDPGTASAPGLKFSDSSATGMFSPSTGVLGFSTGSTQNALTILANGNVGIGTTNPATKLHIFGSNGDTAEIRLQSSDGRTYALGSTGSGYGSTNNFIIYDINGSVERFRINSSGNIGIGTTNPTSKLHVVGLTTLGGILNNLVTISNDGTYTSGSGAGTRLDITYGGSVIARISNTGTGIRDGWFTLYDENTATVNIAANASRGGNTYFNNGGNVGIGTTNPVNKLHLYTGGSGASSFDSRYKLVLENSGEQYIGFFAPDNSYSGLRFHNTTTPLAAIDCFNSTQNLYYYARGGHRFVTLEGGSNADRLNILANGNIGIGTTNPQCPLDVAGRCQVGGSNFNSTVSFGISALGEAYVSSGAVSNRNAYYNAGTICSLVSNTTTVNSGCLIDFNAYNTSGGATGIYIGAAAGTGVNTAANFVVGRRTGTQSWAESLRVDTSGNVGIGTANPLLKLDTRGALHVGGGTDGIWLGNAGDNSAYDNVKLYYTGYNGGGPRVYLTPRTQPGSGNVNTFLHLQSNFTGGPGSNTMGLLVDGSVGIGTTAPQYKLHVVSGGIVGGGGRGTSTTKCLFESNDATGSYWEFQTPPTSTTNDILFSRGTTGNYGIVGYDNSIDKMKFYTAGSWRMAIDSTGNVGIGTTNPGTKLDVHGDIAINGTFAVRRNYYGYSATYNNVFIGSTDSVANTVSLCVDTSTISGGNFHGRNQVIIPRQGLLVPNNAGTNFVGVLSRDSSDYIRIGPDAPGGISSGPITVATSSVGIGTTNPRTALHVNGNIIGSVAGGSGILYTTYGALSSSQVTSYNNNLLGYNLRGWVSSVDGGDGNNNFYAMNTASFGFSGIEQAYGGFINFYTCNSAYQSTTTNTTVTPSLAAVIAPGGNVGIGTTNPDAKLDVRGSITAGGRGLNVPHVVVKDSNGSIRYFEYYFNAQKNTGPGTSTIINIISVSSLSSFHQAAYTVEYGTRLQGIGTDATTSACLKQFGVNKFNSGNVAITDTNDIASDTNSNNHANVTCVTNGASEYIIRVEFSSTISDSSFCSGVIRGWGVNDSIPNITFTTGA